MDVQVIHYSKDVESTWRYAGRDGRRNAYCQATLVPSGDEVPATCRPVADIYIGDTNFSQDCQEERVRHDIKVELCALDADLGVVRPLEDGLVTCYQARTVAYRCGPNRGGDPG